MSHGRIAARRREEGSGKVTPGAITPELPVREVANGTGPFVASLEHEGRRAVRERLSSRATCRTGTLTVIASDGSGSLAMSTPVATNWTGTCVAIARVTFSTVVGVHWRLRWNDKRPTLRLIFLRLERGVTHVIVVPTTRLIGR